MPKFLYPTLVFVVLVVAGIIALHWFENPKSEYDDYSSVVEDDAIGRGWIPDFLPKSATNIVEQHPIDASYGYVSFDADARDIANLYEICRRMEYTEVKYFSSYPYWWPRELVGSTEVSGKLDFYMCEEYGVLTSIDKKRHFYWYIK